MSAPERAIVAATANGYIGDMDRNSAIAILASRAGDIRARGVKSLYLFGSTVRDEAKKSSDIDVLIEAVEEDFSLFDLLEVKYFLDDALDAETDVVLRRCLHPVLRDSIVAEAERVF